MIKPAIGDRVGAICGSDGETLRILGYGVYDGDEIPPLGIKFFGTDLNTLQHTNPKIKLDNGQIVWGCECWWGTEEYIKQLIDKEIAAGIKIQVDNIEDYRKGRGK